MPPIRLQPNSAVLPVTALLVGAIALGTSPILVRLSDLEPTATGFYRVALAFPAFLPFMLMQRDAGAVPASASRALSSEILWLIAAGALFALDLICLHWSLRYTSVANSTLLLNFAPLFVAIGVWAIFGQRPETRTAISFAVAFAGVALLVGGVSTPTPTKLLGDLLGMMAGAAYGGYLLVVSRFRHKTPTSVVMGVTTGSCALFLLPATLVMGESLVPPTATAWSVLVALGLLTHAGGQGLLVYAMRYLPPFTSSITLLLQPVVAACCAWILFSETLGLWQMLGAGVVLLGIVLCHDSTARADRSRATAVIK